MNDTATLTPPMLPADCTLLLHEGQSLRAHLPRWEAWLAQRGPYELSWHPGWLPVFEQGLDHRVYCLEAKTGDRCRGFLPLCYISSFLFGKFLVSLPYLNYGGPFADEPALAMGLVDEAVKLADRLRVQHLELRLEQPLEHPALTHRLTSKVHMRLGLAAADNDESLMKLIPSKVRNQIRKGQKSNLTVLWGRHELIDNFYDVFSRNMRDLGTPVFGKKLFTHTLSQFPQQAELCVVKLGDLPVAAGLLVHGLGTSEILSASSLREHNATCANMLLYWQLLLRSVERKQKQFDFGRSTVDSPTYRFKAQWGAQPAPATWQYYVRSGNPTDMRQDNPKYQRRIKLWQKLPVWLTRLLGPRIIRGVP